MVDQLRASALELYRELARDAGLTLARTAHLDALARSGVRYRCFTPSPVSSRRGWRSGRGAGPT